MQLFKTATVVFLFVCLQPGLPTAVGQDESKEPPLEFVVTVGDKSITLGEGKSAKLEGKFTNPTISVTPQPFRVFPYQGISFKYPRSFVFEADLADPDEKIFTLSGNDLTIMYIVMNAQITPNEFANSMIGQFGRENTRVIDSNATLKLGKQTFSGNSIQITVATHRMVMNIYKIPSRGSVTKLLVFQDSLDDAGNRSKEGKKTLEVMKSSFTTGQGQ